MLNRAVILATMTVLINYPNLHDIPVIYMLQVIDFSLILNFLLSSNPNPGLKSRYVPDEDECGPNCA